MIMVYFSEMMITQVQFSRELYLYTSTQKGNSLRYNRLGDALG